MTRTTNSRLAGIAFLVYIASGIASMALTSPSSVKSIVTLFPPLSALVLGVTLYALTRGEDPELALLALTCRVVEAIPMENNTNAIFFAVGSTIFCWLFLRGRLIPVALASLGVVASVLLLAILPLQRAGLLGGPTKWTSSLTWLIWLPMLVFELALSFWLLFKGATFGGGSAKHNASTFASR